MVEPPLILYPVFGIVRHGSSFALNQNPSHLQAVGFLTMRETLRAPKVLGSSTSQIIAFILSVLATKWFTYNK
jgi:hypothetical protein